MLSLCAAAVAGLHEVHKYLWVLFFFFLETRGRGKKSYVQFMCSQSQDKNHLSLIRNSRQNLCTNIGMSSKGRSEGTETLLPGELNKNCTLPQSAAGHKSDPLSLLLPGFLSCTTDPHVSSESLRTLSQSQETSALSWYSCQLYSQGRGVTEIVKENIEIKRNFKLNLSRLPRELLQQHGMVAYLYNLGTWRLKQEDG